MQDTKTITTYRQELSENILHTALKLFWKKGIKAVKMDDIAAQMSISKRTLYELYRNKEVLLLECLKLYQKQKKDALTNNIESSQNVMDIMLKAYREKVDESRYINPVIYSDIEKYPEVKKYINSQEHSSQQDFVNYINRGIDEGFFRSDINPELVCHLFDALVRQIRTAQLYRHYSVEVLLNNFLFISVRGLCTQKGVAVLDDFFK